MFKSIYVPNAYTLVKVHYTLVALIPPTLIPPGQNLEVPQLRSDFNAEIKKICKQPRFGPLCMITFKKSLQPLCAFTSRRDKENIRNEYE